MNNQDAAQLAGQLIASTTGWNDEAAEALINNIRAKWTDTDCAREAIQEVVDTWTRQSRPPWAVCLDAYRHAVRRQALAAPALPSSSGKIIPPREGRKIAARAYASQCRSAGREPNWDYFDRLAGTIGNSDDT